jgi:hypothetical protein
MNASSMCANCYGFLDSAGYCKKCRRISEAAPLQKKADARSEIAGDAKFASELPTSALSDPKLIKAINKMTFAVRSIALFLFISLCSSIFGSALIAVSAGELSLVIFGSIVIAAGFLIALVIGISELGKSKP